jgi:hypothetical protein
MHVLADFKGFLIYNTLLMRVVMTNRRGMIWMIGFIDTSYTPLWTIANYSDTANLRILQITAANTNVLSLLQSPPSVPWQRILKQELYKSHQITHSSSVPEKRSWPLERDGAAWQRVDTTGWPLRSHGLKYLYLHLHNISHPSHPPWIDICI